MSRANTNNIRHHAIIALRRNKYFEDTMCVNIIKILISLMFYSYWIILGFFIDTILVEIAPKTPISISFFYLFLIFLFLDFVLKVPFLKSNLYNVLPYITLPLNRQLLYRQNIFRNIVKTWNLVGVLFFAPFFLKMFLVGKESILFAFGGVLLTYALSLFNSALVRWCKSFTSIKCILAIVCSIIAYVAIVCVGVNFDAICNVISGLIRNVIFLTIISALVVYLAYKISLSQCQREFYKVSEQKDTAQKRASLQLFNYAKISPITKLVLSMVLRNKAARSLIIFAFLLGIPYLIIAILTKNYWQIPIFGPMACGPIIFAVSPIMSYAAFFADNLATTSPKLILLLLKKYFKFHLLLGIIPTIIVMIVTKEYLLLTTIYLLTTSIFSVLFLRLNVFATQRIDILVGYKKPTVTISAKSVLNRVVGLTPLIIFGVLFVLFPNSKALLYCSIGVSLVVIIFNKHIINNIYIKFMQNRYENLACLRGDE